MAAQRRWDRVLEGCHNEAKSEETIGTGEEKSGGCSNSRKSSLDKNSGDHGDTRC